MYLNSNITNFGFSKKSKNNLSLSLQKVKYEEVSPETKFIIDYDKKNWRTTFINVSKMFANMYDVAFQHSTILQPENSAQNDPLKM